MNRFNKIIKSIFSFFDRYVIMPITRLIYKITRKFSVPSKKFETWLSKSTTLLFFDLQQ